MITVRGRSAGGGDEGGKRRDEGGCGCALGIGTGGGCNGRLDFGTRGLGLATQQIERITPRDDLLGELALRQTALRRLVDQRRVVRLGDR